MCAVKIYGITASGADPERRNLEQKVMLANSVAQSFLSPDNVNSRGQRMFLVRRQNSEKWTTSGPDPPRDVIDHQQRWEDGGAWPQQAPAGRQHYVTGQPPHRGYPQPSRQMSVPSHYMPSGPRPARSTSMEGPTAPHHQGQFPARAAVPGPQQYGVLKGPTPQTPPQHRRGPGPQPQGFLRPARPLAPMPGTGAPAQQVRNRSESFGSLPVVGVRSSTGDWHSPVTHQQRDRHLSGDEQYPQPTRQWPAAPSQPPIMQRSAVTGHYGISDL